MNIHHISKSSPHLASSSSTSSSSIPPNPNPNLEQYYFCNKWHLIAPSLLKLPVTQRREQLESRMEQLQDRMGHLLEEMAQMVASNASSASSSTSSSRTRKKTSKTSAKSNHKQLLLLKIKEMQNLTLALMRSTASHLHLLTTKYDNSHRELQLMQEYIEMMRFCLRDVWGITESREALLDWILAEEELQRPPGRNHLESELDSDSASLSWHHHQYLEIAAIFDMLWNPDGFIVTKWKRRHHGEILQYWRRRHGGMMTTRETGVGQEVNDSSQRSDNQQQQQENDVTPNSRNQPENASTFSDSALSEIPINILLQFALDRLPSVLPESTTPRQVFLQIQKVISKFYGSIKFRSPLSKQPLLKRLTDGPSPGEDIFTSTAFKQAIERNILQSAKTDFSASPFLGGSDSDDDDEAALPVRESRLRDDHPLRRHQKRPSPHQLAEQMEEHLRENNITASFPDENPNYFALGFNRYKEIEDALESMMEEARSTEGLPGDVSHSQETSIRGTIDTQNGLPGGENSSSFAHENIGTSTSHPTTTTHYSNKQHKFFQSLYKKIGDHLFDGNTLDQRCYSMKDELSSLRETLADMRAYVLNSDLEMKIQLKSLEADFELIDPAHAQEHLRKELESLRKENASLKEKNDELKQKASANSLYEQEQMMRQRENEWHQKEVSLQDQIARLQAQLQTLTGQREDDLEALRKQLTSKYEGIIARHDAQMREMNTNNADSAEFIRSEYRERLEEKDRTIDEQSKHIDTLKRIRKEQEAEINALLAKIRRLNRKPATEEKPVQTLQKIYMTRKELKDMRKNLTSLIPKEDDTYDVTVEEDERINLSKLKNVLIFKNS